MFNFVFVLRYLDFLPINSNQNLHTCKDQVDLLLKLVLFLYYKMVVFWPAFL